MTYILILAMYMSGFSKYDANALSSTEFSTKATCETAGKAASDLASGGKTIRYVCVQK